MSDRVIDKKEFTLSIEEILERLERIEGKVDNLIEQRTAKEFYSTAEVAELLGRAEWTVREWARLKRIHATKRLSGRGNAREWCISHSELKRIEQEGLLPQPDIFHRLKNAG